MVNLIFRKGKKENETYEKKETYEIYNGKKITKFDKKRIEDYKKSFWWTLIIEKFLVIPYNDIGENRSNASYLRDIAINDNNIYRRALSTFLLFREHDLYPGEDFGSFWRNFKDELNNDDAKEIRHEITYIILMQVYNEFFVVYANLDNKSHDELREELREERKHIKVVIDGTLKNLSDL